MQEKEFVALVNKLELYERDHPATYRLRVGLLAALGYLVLFGALGISLAIVIGIIYARQLNLLIIEILIVVVALAFVILRSLWIEFPEPEGRELKHDDAPRLFELVNEVRAATAGPSLHKVLLTSDYNAYIVQRPRFGIFGWHDNYLQIGLPLLRALSPTDIRAIVAHEFGHLSGSHGKFTSWIYLVRQTWIQMMQATQQQRRNGLGVFVRFFRWYAPYFNAYSFVLARAQEYEADRCAASVSGKEKMACALVNMRLKGMMLAQDFWPALNGRADTDPEPPRESFTEMLQSLRDPIPAEKARGWFSETLTVRHRYDDTHPALADRLAAMGYAEVRQNGNLESFVAGDDEPRADQYLLARLPEEFIEQHNNSWREGMAGLWTERHKFVAEAQQALAGFEEKVQTTDLTIDERWERARFLAGKDGNVAAMSLMREVLALAPDHAAANYMLGEALLTQGDEAGIKHLEAAMEKDVHAVPAGCDAIVSFLTARERAEEADKYRDCIDAYYDELEWAQRERENAVKSDAFQSHELPSEAIDALREQLAKVPLLESAYLVQKVCKHFPQDTFYILGVISRRFLALHLKGRDVKLVEELATKVIYPARTLIVPLEDTHRPLRKIFKRFDGAEIYRAADYNEKLP